MYYCFNFCVYTFNTNDSQVADFTIKVPATLIEKPDAAQTNPFHHNTFPHQQY